MSNVLDIYVDGSWNPCGQSLSPSGWGMVALKRGAREPLKISKGRDVSSNIERAEVKAFASAIQLAKRAPKGVQVVIHTDCQHMINTLSRMSGVDAKKCGRTLECKVARSALKEIVDEYGPLVEGCIGGVKLAWVKAHKYDHLSYEEVYLIDMHAAGNYAADKVAKMAMKAS